MGIEQGRAQRWHDTDHGRDRGRPLRPNRFRRPVDDPRWPPFSACWCCCEVCDPAAGGRPNPFWVRALAEQKETAPAR